MRAWRPSSGFLAGHLGVRRFGASLLSRMLPWHCGVLVSDPFRLEAMPPRGDDSALRRCRLEAMDDEHLGLRRAAPTMYVFQGSPVTQFGDTGFHIYVGLSSSNSSVGFVEYKEYTSRISSSDGMRVSGRYKFLFSRFEPEGYYIGALYLTRNALVAANPICTFSCSTVFRDVHGAAHELHPAVQALALADNGSQCVRSRHKRL
jgi:hypothetical protein